MVKETMDVTTYAEYIKASLDDMKVAVDDLVAAESDGKIDVSEALVIIMTHLIANLGIWKDFLPIIGRK